MKNILFSIFTLLFVCIAVSTQAQPQHKKFNAEDMSKMQTEMMKKELNLSDKQTTEVSAINLKFAKKMDEQRKNSDGDREAMHEEMEAMQEERNAELKKVLTEEQYEKMLAKEEEMKKKPRSWTRRTRKTRINIIEIKNKPDFFS